MLDFDMPLKLTRCNIFLHRFHSSRISFFVFNAIYVFFYNSKRLGERFVEENFTFYRKDFYHVPLFLIGISVIGILSEVILGNIILLLPSGGSTKLNFHRQ